MVNPNRVKRPFFTKEYWTPAWSAFSVCFIMVVIALFLGAMYMGNTMFAWYTFLIFFWSVIGYQTLIRFFGIYDTIAYRDTTIEENLLNLIQKTIEEEDEIDRELTQNIEIDTRLELITRRERDLEEEIRRVRNQINH